MNYIEITGDHFTVGYHTGQWWARYFIQNRERPAMKELLRKYDYFGYLDGCWDIRKNEYAPLLANTMKLCPEVIEEIAGIEKGATTAFMELGEWICPSFLDVFCLSLGETGDPDYNCSSAILKTKDGTFIGHNDEYTKRFPLLVAKVTLITAKGTRKLVSVSYPFQILGAAVGMNERIIYAHNSIGCIEQDKKLWNSWGGRLPKTVITRRLLEARTQGEIDAVFDSVHFTLPNHYYIATRDAAWSYEIRPRLDVTEPPALQVRKRFIAEGIDFSANHFKESDGHDAAWAWSTRGMKESIDRYRLMQERLESGHGGPARVKETLTYLAKHRRFCKRTAASIFMSARESGTSMTGYFYFNEGFETRCGIRVPSQ